MRLVTLNFWGTEPPLDRRLDLAIRQLRALAVDVVCLQECRPLDGLAGRTTADAIAEGLGMQAVYAKSVGWEAGQYGPTAGQEGLAVIARSIGETRALPLPEPRVADARLLLSAQVATEGGPIWVHTTHLHYRLDDGVAREKQVCAVDAAIRAMGRGNDDAPRSCAATSTPPRTPTRSASCAASRRSRAGGRTSRTRGCARTATPPGSRGRARTS